MIGKSSIRKQASKTAVIILLLLSFFFISAQLYGESANSPKSSVMNHFQAVVLGIVEGLTEYLPVSSTGHLLMAEKVMKIGDDTNPQVTDAIDAFTIVIQGGAILAVLWLYFGRIKQVFRGIAGKDAGGRRIFINLIAGFLPAAVIGLTFNNIIKTYLFGPWPVIIAWFVGGIAILVVSWRRRKGEGVKRTGLSLEDMTWRIALIIGFAQCIAMWPGVSRSLVTIVGGLLLGLTMESAVEFSFLLGVITLGAATAYDALKHGAVILQTIDHLSLVIGIVVAFAAAVVSVKWMVSYLSRNGLAVFGYYRVIIAVASLLFLIMTKAI